MIYESGLKHHGILGMKWGVRRYQNKDGGLTSAGRKRYNSNRTTDSEIINARKNVESARKYYLSLEEKWKEAPEGSVSQGKIYTEMRIAESKYIKLDILANSQTKKEKITKFVGTAIGVMGTLAISALMSSEATKAHRS